MRIVILIFRMTHQNGNLSSLHLAKERMNASVSTVANAEILPPIMGILTKLLGGRLVLLLECLPWIPLKQSLLFSKMKKPEVTLRFFIRPAFMHMFQSAHPRGVRLLLADKKLLPQIEEISRATSGQFFKISPSRV